MDTDSQAAYSSSPPRSAHGFVSEPARAKAETIRRFFEHDLPLKAASDVHRLFGTSGSIAFRIGLRAWTFRFANIAPIDDFFDAGAELQLWFSEAAFAELISGEIDVVAAVGRGDIRARGHIRLLEAFGKFLQTEESKLGWDAGT